jgi:hypothetical protein
MTATSNNYCKQDGSGGAVGARTRRGGTVMHTRFGGVETQDRNSGRIDRGAVGAQIRLGADVQLDGPQRARGASAHVGG